MAKLQKKQDEWKPIFPGTDSKTIIKAQRQHLMSELEIGAKKLAEMETLVLKINKEFEDVEEKYRQFEASYRFMRSPEAAIVSLKEFQYVRIQYRDFGAKYEAMKVQVDEARAKVNATRASVENWRKNVIYLDEVLRREGKVVELNGYRRKGLEAADPE